MDRPELELEFERPEEFKPFGLMLGLMTREEINGYIRKNSLIVLTPEQPTRNGEGLINPNSSEIVLTGYAIREIFGFPLKGIILNLYKGVLEKVFCAFKDRTERNFDNICQRLKEVYGEPTDLNLQRNAEVWIAAWKYRFYFVSLDYIRNPPEVMLIFGDRTIQKQITAEDSQIFENYFNKQMKILSEE